MYLDEVKVPLVFYSDETREYVESEFNELPKLVKLLVWLDGQYIKATDQTNLNRNKINRANRIVASTVLSRIQEIVKTD